MPHARRGPVKDPVLALGCQTQFAVESTCGCRCPRRVRTAEPTCSPRADIESPDRARDESRGSLYNGRDAVC